MLVRYRELSLTWQSIAATLNHEANAVRIHFGGRLWSGVWGEELVAESRRHLERCVREHAGTPWQLAAECELQATAHSFHWQALVIEPPPPPCGPCNPVIPAAAPVLPRL